MIAFCGSLKCTGIIYSRLTKKDYILKVVNFACTSCPDCKSALVWRKSSNNVRVIDLKRKPNYLSQFKTVG